MKNEAASVQKRCILFQLIEETGNVAEACRTLGVNKSAYYNFKSLYEKYGVVGLKGNNKEDLIHLSSQKSKEDVFDKIAEYAIKNPETGCHKIRNLLFDDDFYLSANAIQNALKFRGLGSIINRIHALEHKAFREGYNLSESQSDLLLKYDPCMKEAESQSNYPGERLVQCIVKTHTSTSEKPLFAYFVLDRYGCLAFLTFDRTESIDVAIRLLNDYVIPYYYKNKIGIGEISLEAEDEPDEESLAKYGGFVKKYGISPRFLENSDEHADGFAQRFKDDLNKGFLCDPGLDLRLEEIESINMKGQIWLEQYNSAPYYGYRNFGHSPNAVISAIKAGKRLI